MAAACMRQVVVMALLTPALSFLIPDRGPFTRRRLVHHGIEGTFYQADRVCRASGGFLVMTDSPAKVQSLMAMDQVLNHSIHNVITGMVRHDNTLLYTHNDRCRQIAETQWSFWRSPSDGSYNVKYQCVWAEKSNFMWLARACELSANFICEYDQDKCVFRKSNVSLSAAPVANASQEVCEDTCRTIIGCFATVPTVTFNTTLCVFLVVNDASNPMTYLDCSETYESDFYTNAALFKDPNDPTADPVDCVPPTAAFSETYQTPLTDFLSTASAHYANYCADATVTHTVYVTQTPDDVIPSTEFLTDIVGSMTSYENFDSATPTVTPVLTSTRSPEVVTETTTVIVTQAVTQIVTQSAQRTTVIVTQAVTQTVTQSAQQTTTVIVTQAVTQSAERTLTVPQTVDPTLAPRCSDSPSSSVISTAPPETTSLESTTTEKLTSPSDVPSSPNPTTPAPNQGDTLQEEMRAIIEELTVDKHSVSRMRRKKKSAEDERWSAKTLGTMAILIVVTVVATVVVTDLPVVIRLILRCYKKKGFPGNKVTMVAGRIKAMRIAALPALPAPSPQPLQTLEDESRTLQPSPSQAGRRCS